MKPRITIVREHPVCVGAKHSRPYPIDYTRDFQRESDRPCGYIYKIEMLQIVTLGVDDLKRSLV